MKRHALLHTEPPWSSQPLAVTSSPLGWEGNGALPDAETLFSRIRKAPEIFSAHRAQQRKSVAPLEMHEIYVCFTHGDVISYCSKLASCEGWSTFCHFLVYSRRKASDAIKFINNLLRFPRCSRLHPQQSLG